MQDARQNVTESSPRGQTRVCSGGCLGAGRSSKRHRELTLRTDSRLFWAMSPFRTLVKSSLRAHLEDRLAFVLGDVSIQDARQIVTESSP